MGGPNGAVVEHVEPCAYQPISDGQSPVSPALLSSVNGNVEWVSDFPANGATWFSEMGSEIVVPSDPANDTQQDAFWVGLANQSDRNMILQPVLQYAVNKVSPGCGSVASITGWSVFNYYIAPDGRVYCGPVSNVSTGDTIDMGVWLDDGQWCDSSGLNCSYQSYYVLNGITYWFEIYGEPLLMNVAYLGALEAYNVSSCADLPPVDSGGFPFWLYALNVPVPQWYSYQNALNYSYWQTNLRTPAAAGLPDCGFYPEFTDAVRLHYHN